LRRAGQATAGLTVGLPVGRSGERESIGCATRNQAPESHRGRRTSRWSRQAGSHVNRPL